MQIINSEIEVLYAIFSTYSGRSDMPACDPCCVNSAAREELFGKRLRDLTHVNLSYYAHLVLSLWGDKNDFRHFLPRILELCTIPRPRGFQLQWDYWRILGKLKTEAGFWTWPKDEVEAVEIFLKDWWKNTLSNTAESVTECHLATPHEAANVIGGLGCTYDDILPFLHAWSKNGSASAIRHFVLGYPFLPGFGWSTEQVQQLHNWLSDSQTLTWLENGYIEYSNESWADELASTVDTLSLAISTGTLPLE